MFVFIRSLVINYFKADTILLGMMGVKKTFKHFNIKFFNENMINKNVHVLQLHLCSTVMQNIQIFYQVPVMLFLTCFLHK